MKIQTSYDALISALNTVMATFTDKSVGVDLQTIVLQATEQGCTMCTGTCDTHCITVLETKKIEGECSINIPSKALYNALMGYAGLHTTIVESVMLEVDDETGALSLTVREVPKENAEGETAETDTDNATESVIRLQTVKMQNVHFDMLKTLEKQLQIDNAAYTTIETAEIMKYLQAALPAIPADENYENLASKITFDAEYVYVVPRVYALLMKNTLPEVFRHIIIKKTMAQFLKVYLKGTEKVQVCVQDYATIGNVTQLTIKTENSLATMRAYSTAKKFDITTFINMPTNRVVINKAYFMDILRRLNCIGEEVYIRVDCDAKNVELANAVTHQSISAMAVEGTGIYEFVLMPDVLTKLVTANGISIGAKLCICVEKSEDGRTITLGITDDTQMWSTKIKDMLVQRGDFAWN